MLGESATVNPETVIDWKNRRTVQNSRRIPAKRHIFNVDETGFFYNLQPSETLTYKGDSCHGGTKSLFC